MRLGLGRLQKMTVRSRVCLSAALLVLFCQLPPVQAAGGSSAAPVRLSAIESVIDGGSRAGKSISGRVKELEMKVFGKTKAGSLNDRISALEEFAGISRSEIMPPLPPERDKRNSTAGSNAGSGKLNPGSGKASAGSAKAGAGSGKASAGSGQKDLDRSLEEAVSLHSQGKVSQAEKSLRQILEISPGNADAYFSLGAIAETRGDLQAALDFYTSAAQANPNDSEATEAAAELSRKITAARAEQFVNPLNPAPSYTMSAENPRVLQGSALDISVNGATQSQSPFYGNARNQGRRGASLGVSQTSPPAFRAQPSTGSTIARTLARAALTTALSGSGLHCPMCQLLRGF